MKRREFLGLVGGAAAAWPVVARAQQSVSIGLLGSRSSEESAHLMTAFRAGLRDQGYTEGQNLVIESRWAEGRYDRLSALAADLVSRKVAVIFATGGATPALAAKNATTQIAVVFVSGDDPVEYDLVKSLSRPGGNVTGVALMLGSLGSKRLELLSELVPSASIIAFLVNPTAPNIEAETQEIEAAAASIGRKILVLKAANEAEIHAAFATLAELGVGALATAADPYFGSRRSQLVTLAARYRVPAIYTQRDFPVAGGLMSYGSKVLEAYQQAGVYVGRILRGEKPADLPVVQASKFEFVLNLGTAKAFGLTIPPKLLALADEVIE